MRLLDAIDLAFVLVLKCLLVRGYGCQPANSLLSIPQTLAYWTSLSIGDSFK